MVSYYFVNAQHSSWICSLSNNWDVDNYNWLIPIQLVFTWIIWICFPNWVHRQLIISTYSFFYSTFFFLWKWVKVSSVSKTSLTCNHTIHHLLPYKFDSHKTYLLHIQPLTYLIWRTVQSSNWITWHWDVFSAKFTYFSMNAHRINGNANFGTVVMANDTLFILHSTNNYIISK